MPSRLWRIADSPISVAMTGVGTKMETSSTHETLKIVMNVVSGIGLWNTSSREGSLVHQTKAALIHDLHQLADYLSILTNGADIESLRGAIAL